MAVVLQSSDRNFPEPVAAPRRTPVRRRRNLAAPADIFTRETFVLPREAARVLARDWFARFPKVAYWTTVERWRLLPDGAVEFTMCRLPTAD